MLSFFFSKKKTKHQKINSLYFKRQKIIDFSKTGFRVKKRVRFKKKSKILVISLKFKIISLILILYDHNVNKLGQLLGQVKFFFCLNVLGYDLVVISQNKIHNLFSFFHPTDQNFIKSDQQSKKTI